MCGRYTLTDPGDLLTELGVEDPGDLEPRYNIAPTQEAPVVRPGADGRELASLRWGLVPWWAKNPSQGARMINARSETAAEKPAFREAFRQRRCVVLADGFYEWKASRGKGPKQPYRILRADRRPFVFAGLWEHWRKATPDLLTYTILTTEASPAIRQLHDRMPVFLSRDAWDLWLDPQVDDPAILQTVLRPLPSEQLTFQPVSRRVGSVANDDPGCIEVISLDEPPASSEPSAQGEQLGLF